MAHKGFEDKVYSLPLQQISNKQHLKNELDSKFGAHTLPPCKVCSAQATGYHYGVNTCEACKGFFHRSLNKKDPYVCLKNSKCVLKPGNRSLCPFCRYKRCLAIGMSKSGIKTGRYSYAKRTQDILEIKAISKEFPVQNFVPINNEQPTNQTKTQLFSAEKIKTIQLTLLRLREARDKFITAQVQATNTMQLDMITSKIGGPLDGKVIQAIASPVDADHNVESFLPKFSTNNIMSSLRGGEVPHGELVQKISIFGISKKNGLDFQISASLQNLF